jgi:azurin
MRVRGLAAVVALCVVTVAGADGNQRGTAPPAGPVRTITITVNDPVGEKMVYSLSTINATPGQRLRVRLMSLAKTPKIVMAHNWVLLKSGTDPKAFTDAAANARATDFIPPTMKNRILAEIGMVGPGETLEVIVTVPTAPGSYDYVCTFAGHYAAGMFGKLVVK